ncbi:MAG TPA: 4-(cytidine 5'-diphospho)-2-C-methyl-D-erythritol kinase, partial [Geminicoccaceae bacterium]
RGAPPVEAAAGRWMTSGRNDLEAAAVRLEPAVGEVLDRLRRLPGVRLARMSGSGATCFGWFGDAAGARRAADLLADARSGWWIRPVVAGGRP